MSNEYMGDILKTIPHWDKANKKWRTEYSTLTDTEKKHAAASVVLELIKADISATSQRTGTRLDEHLSNLPKYISQVIVALEEDE
ncbi:hypothetical protein [Vibrio parahaemolyticus]|uniref:hypothetical protein n=1 Tax=Vibrio TaxID=662 RepID=UPI001AD8364E|nr:hypothetical protein [Vibrio parahaemolyticus]MDF4731696.1 hypothetical protein [Vibrio parahaemolyticus]MDG2604535.1 hypothetical protein [Vibrio parahaemolyticus]QRH14469.1 hypothetical protein JCT84_19805 [Vibrio parahaemolyticus]